MGEIRLVGTAHVSQESVDEVLAAIEAFTPDVIAVELDAGRYAGLKKQGTEPEVGDILKGGNFNQLLVQWVLGYIQRRIGMDVGVEPGAEMKAAIEAAEERGVQIGLIDRDIGITLQRFWGAMTLWEKCKMIYALGASLIWVDEGEIDIESLKQQDVISAALEEFRRFSPNGAKALIDERDAYLAHQLIGLSGRFERVLAVIGAGHRQGIEQYLLNPASLPPITDLTARVKSPPWGKIIGIAMILMFAFTIVMIIFSGVGFSVLLYALLYWVILHGVLTAIFTLAAGGHPLSALTGFVVSGYTALNPILAAGWFSAIVEAKIRKPTKQDFHKIFEAESFGEMRKNPLFRVVMVAALANVGSTIGTFAYFILIFPALGIDPAVMLGQGMTNFWHWITMLI